MNSRRAMVNKSEKKQLVEQTHDVQDLSTFKRVKVLLEFSINCIATICESLSHEL